MLNHCTFVFSVWCTSVSALVTSRVNEGAQFQNMPELPPETWELARAWTQNNSMLLGQGGGIAKGGPNYADTERGLCYAAPMEESVMKNWIDIKVNEARGLNRAKSMKVLFIGLIRNAGIGVMAGYDMLMHFARKFADYRFMIWENDSDDNTVPYLKQLAEKNHRFFFKSEVLGTKNDRQLQASRLRRMAEVRNKLHDWVQKFLDGSQWDLIVNLDFDLGLFGQHAVTPNMFFATLGRTESVEDKWDMVCSNSLRHYGDRVLQPIGHHDCFAFRTEGNDEMNSPACWETIAKTLFTANELHPVHSCFGGLAFYKPSAFSRCHYHPEVYDCEHVPFHKCMRETGSEGRMFMDPMLTTLFSWNIDQKCLDEMPAEARSDPEPEEEPRPLPCSAHRSEDAEPCPSVTEAIATEEADLVATEAKEADQ